MLVVQINNTGGQINGTDFVPLTVAAGGFGQDTRPDTATLYGGTPYAGDSGAFSVGLLIQALADQFDPSNPVAERRYRNFLERVMGRQRGYGILFEDFLCTLLWATENAAASSVVSILRSGVSATPAVAGITDANIPVSTISGNIRKAACFEVKKGDVVIINSDAAAGSNSLWIELSPIDAAGTVTEICQVNATFGNDPIG